MSSELPYLRSYGEKLLGDGLPALVIAVTHDGKTGMSGKRLAELFRCDIRDLASLIYGNTGGFIGGKNDSNSIKPQSGRGVSLVSTHRIPLDQRAGGKELHLFPSEHIAKAAVPRLIRLADKGIDHPPLTAFVEYCVARTLDLEIKGALNWKPTDRFLRPTYELAPYKPKFTDLYQECVKKFGVKPTPLVWNALEEIMPGMVEAVRSQKKVTGSRYNHMEFNEDGSDQLVTDTSTAMAILKISDSFTGFLQNLTKWRSSDSEMLDSGD